VKFAYYFPGRWVPADPALMSGRVHNQLARAAEGAGFDGVALDEHPAPTEAWRQGPGGHDALDPFVALAAVASATERIRVLTYLTVLPYRNPFLLAKAAATLDVISDGRLVLGVGTGYMRGEFAALGVDFDRRNELFDETLEVLKLAWTGEPVTYRGHGFSADAVTLQPRPLQQPHPPIWIGGNSQLTRRRVVADAQGWMTMPNRRSATSSHKTPALETIDDLRELTTSLRELAERQGRVEPIDIVHSARDAPMGTSEHIDWLHEIEALGVTWVTVNGTGRSPDEAESLVGAYGADVIAQFRP